jgi:MFS family permease
MHETLPLTARYTVFVGGQIAILIPCVWKKSHHISVAFFVFQIHTTQPVTSNEYLVVLSCTRTVQASFYFTMGAVRRMGRLIISGFTYSFCQQAGNLLQPLIAEIVGDTRKAAMLYGIASVLNLIAQFVCLPSLGAFGDAYGRKRMMGISGVGLTIATICYAIVYSKDMIAFVFIGMIIQGVFGGFVANSQAMVVDLSAADERPKFFAVYFILASATALIFGPVVCGIIASVAGIHVALFIAAGVGLFSVIWTSFALKETLPEDMRQKVTWERMNPCAPFFMILKAEFLAGFLIIVFCVGFGMGMHCYGHGHGHGYGRSFLHSVG